MSWGNAKAYSRMQNSLHFSVWRNRNLTLQLTRREISGRYRGSALGILWSLLTPLFMLAIYTFVFGTIFQSRWTSTGSQSNPAPHATAEFAIILFVGLIIFQLFAEVINRAPSLILSNATYVRKVVFPLEVLPLVALGTALFHAGVGFLVLIAAIALLLGHVPATALLLPLILAPFLLLVLGLAWFLASLGVFVRDITQVLSTLVTGLMFLSPIFFPMTALPVWLQPYLLINPLVVPVEEARKVLIWGAAPDWSALAVYTLIALTVAALGRLWFEKTRRGFADVL